MEVLLNPYFHQPPNSYGCKTTVIFALFWFEEIADSFLMYRLCWNLFFIIQEFLLEKMPKISRGCMSLYQAIGGFWSLDHSRDFGLEQQKMANLSTFSLILDSNMLLHNN